MVKPDLGVSPITGEIYAGRKKASKLSPKLKEWFGEKHDVTDEAIRCVFEHMLHHAKETGYYGVTYKGFGTMSLSIESTEIPQPKESV